MHITWHGNYTIKIQVGEKIIIIDPHGSDGKLSPFRGKADIVALTNPTDPNMSSISGIQGDPLVLGTPGEYSAEGFTLNALGWHDSDNHERSIQRWEIERMIVLHLGPLENRELTTEELQHLETTTVDIMFLPVGGGSGLTTKAALKLLTTIEPRMVIPVNYNVGNSNEKLDSVEQFAKEMGLKPSETEKKLLVKANKLPEDAMQTVLLSP